jgi:hypothetical protein
MHHQWRDWAGMDQDTALFPNLAKWLGYNRLRKLQMDVFAGRTLQE